MKQKAVQLIYVLVEFKHLQVILCIMNGGISVVFLIPDFAPDYSYFQEIAHINYFNKDLALKSLL